MNPDDKNPKAKWPLKPKEKKEETKPVPSAEFPYKNLKDVSNALMKAGRGNPEFLTQIENDFGMKYDGKDWDEFCGKVREKFHKLS